MCKEATRHGRAMTELKEQRGPERGVSSNFGRGRVTTKASLYIYGLLAVFTRTSLPGSDTTG